MNNNKLDYLEEVVNSLQDKIALIGNSLNVIIEELGEQNTDFQSKFIASTLSVDSFRDSFTEFVNEVADDDMKFTMIEVNEMIERLRNEGRTS